MTMATTIIMVTARIGMITITATANTTTITTTRMTNDQRALPSS